MQTYLFDTAAWSYDLCRRCTDNLLRRFLRAMNDSRGWGEVPMLWDTYRAE